MTPFTATYLPRNLPVSEPYSVLYSALDGGPAVGDKLPKHHGQQQTSGKGQYRYRSEGLGKLIVDDPQSSHP